MTLQTAVQAAIAEWEEHGFATDGQMEYLRKALADEQAQAVEPVAWMYDWQPDEEVVTDWLTTDYDEAHSPTMGIYNIRPLYTHPAPPPAQQVAVRQAVEPTLSEILAAKGITLQKTFVEKPRDTAPPATFQDELVMLTAIALYEFQEATGCDTAAQFKTQQVAVPAPMTEEHIYELAKRITKEDAAPFEEVAARPGWAGFIEIVRAIEAHHGIGAKPDHKPDWSAA